MLWGGKKKKKIFFEYFSNRIEKLHKMAFILFFFSKKLKKLELSPKKVSVRCTPSLILGFLSVASPKIEPCFLGAIKRMYIQVFSLEKMVCSNFIRQPIF